MLTYQVGDRVVLLYPWKDIAGYPAGPPVGTEGRVAGILPGTDASQKITVEWDEMFPRGHSGSGLGKDGHCWRVGEEHIQLIEHRIPSQGKVSEGVPAGYTRTPDGFLTNPDNWAPRKRLF